MVHYLLSTSYEEYTTVAKALSVFHEYLVLSLFRKVDKYITTDDEVISLLIRILKKIMLFKLNS